MQCCFNSIGNRSNFRSWREGFTIRENLSATIGEQFGPNTLVVLAAQNYENLKYSRSSFKNVLEIYDVKNGSTVEESQEILTTLRIYRLMDLFWITYTSALATYQNEVEANSVLNIRCRLFKSRKLEDGSDLAILAAVNLAWPRNFLDKRSAFSIQVDEWPPWELYPSSGIHHHLNMYEMYQNYHWNCMQGYKRKKNQSCFTGLKLEDIPEEPEDLDNQTIQMLRTTT